MENNMPSSRYGFDSLSSNDHWEDESDNSYFNFTTNSWGDMMDEEELWDDDKKNTKSKPSQTRKPLSSKQIENDSTATKKYLKDARMKCTPYPRETDQKRLQKRQRQIDIGKNTEGYKYYVKDVRKYERTKDHPWTPDKLAKCSTRSWQGSMRIWRRKLHFWDPEHVIKERQQNFFDILPRSIEKDNFQD